MEFTCVHCEKPIIGLSVLIDKTYVLHVECKSEFEINRNKLEDQIAEDLVE